MTAAEIGTIISIIGSVVAIYISWRRAPIENDGLRLKNVSTGGEALIQYQTALDTASKQIAELTDSNAKLQDRVAELETKARENPRKFAETTAKLSQLEIKVADLEHENALLRNWAGRLSRQVEYMGGTPAPFREEGEKRKTGPLPNLPDSDD